jgi:hypothetical protein
MENQRANLAMLQRRRVARWGRQRLLANVGFASARKMPARDTMKPLLSSTRECCGLQNDGNRSLLVQW